MLIPSPPFPFRFCTEPNDFLHRLLHAASFLLNLFVPPTTLCSTYLACVLTLFFLLALSNWFSKSLSPFSPVHFLVLVLDSAGCRGPADSDPAPPPLTDHLFFIYSSALFGAFYLSCSIRGLQMIFFVLFCIEFPTGFLFPLSLCFRLF